MREVVNQNNFSRSLYNDAKAGAYYTDVGHCLSLGEMFRLPDDEVCVLEPSIGNGAGVAAFLTGAGADATKVKVFGVELNSTVAKEVRKDIEACLCEDFLHGVKISHKSFSLCFCNPPYGRDGTTNDRYEKLFLEKLADYLIPGALLVDIVPRAVASEEAAFVKALLRGFEVLTCYKFREPEFAKFKQVAIIARKKENPGYDAEKEKEFRDVLDNITELPEHPKGEKYDILPGNSSDISMFASNSFDPDAFDSLLRTSPLLEKVSGKLFKEPYRGNALKQPIIPLSDDMLYLLAVSGAGQGVAGSEASRDLHLQRGRVKRIRTESLETDASSGKQVITEKKYSTISLTIIEPSGKITRFDDKGAATLEDAGGESA